MPHPPANPPMTYAPAYYADHEKTPSPLSDILVSSAVTEPYPVVRGTISRPKPRDPSHQLLHPFVSSYNSLPEAPESLSGSSTASYSHPENDTQRASPVSFIRATQAERGAIGDRVAPKVTGRLEKSPRSPAGTSSSPRESSHPTQATVITYTRDDESMPESKDHVAWVLFCLSCITPFFSICVASYTILSLFLLLFLMPLRLLRSNSSLRHQTSRLLSPPLNLHLRMICSHDTVADSSRPSGAYDIPMLLMVHLVSPFTSVGVAFAVWIAASFWIFTAIMGNPDGTERKDDGKAAVLGVRNWWERWLTRAIK